MNFFYSFTHSLIHSIWQAALILLLYIIVNVFTKKIHPLQNRNVLYILLLLQFFITAFTFYIYFYNISLLSSFYFINKFSVVNDYAIIFFCCYLVIVFVKVVLIFYQWLFFKNTYTKHLIKPMVEIKLFTTVKSIQLGIKRKVQVWYSNQIQVPITFGFFKPVILLPFGLVNNLNMQEIETIILHELTHIKSKDYFFNWILVFLEIGYFFNPFVKLIINKLKIEREKNCDVQVIHFNYDAINYAQVLLKIARYNKSIKSFQMGAVKNTAQLFKRIQFFSFTENLNFKKNRMAFYHLLIVPILFLITTLFVQSSIKAKKPISFSFGFEHKIAFKKQLFSNEINSYNITNNELVIDNLPKEKANMGNKPLPKETPNTDQPYYSSVINEIDDVELMPVYYEDIIDSVKEVQYNIENANGKMTQSFKLIKQNGIWKIYPQWMITETNGRLDSIHFPKTNDSLYKKLDFQ